MVMTHARNPSKQVRSSVASLHLVHHIAACIAAALFSNHGHCMSLQASMCSLTPLVSKHMAFVVCQLCQAASCVHIQGVGPWETVRTNIMETMLMLHNITDNASLQEQLLCRYIDIVQAMLFGKPAPNPKVGYSPKAHLAMAHHSQNP